MHPDIDPNEIGGVIRLIPSRATRAGNPRATPNGTLLRGVYDFSCWTHQFDLEGESELGTALQSLVAQLQKHRQFFHRIVDDGGTVELFCGVFAGGNWDEVLPHPLLGQLSDLRVDLRLDVYPDHHEERV